MYYWNKENFDGLKAVAEHYAENEDFKHFSDYCKYQELGLRKKALQSIKEFVSRIDSLAFENQKGIASEIIELQFFNSNIHQLSSHPLQQKLIVIFEKWSLEADASADPFRWLGCLKSDPDLFKEALKRDHTDQISIHKLADEYLDRVDYQLHHLGDSILLGSIEEAELSLLQAQRYIERIESSQKIEYYTKEWKELNSLLNLWRRYSAEESKLSFPDWAKIEGHDLGFPSTYYYDKS